jgi:DNA (cytosine-5)-methyltransferase 1
MKHASLFSGIGGFDLAAEWMGWENAFHCEWNEFGQRVLKHYWPQAISYGDITKTDFTIWRERIDILTGGFPCQPYSAAGKRLGKEDERHLWPEMLRAIREIQPRWVVGENVRGLTNWNGGVVFDEVQSDLEAEGYEVLPFLVPACGKDAPHRRDRIWFVAHTINDRHKAGRRKKDEENRVPCQRWQKVESGQLNRTNIPSTTPHTDSDGQQRGDSQHEVNAGQRGVDALGDVEQSLVDGDVAHAHSNKRPKGGVYKTQSEISERNFGSRNAPSHERSTWQNFPTQPPICGGNDGLPAELDGITFSKWRNESIKAYGNAIVPQVALEIFKAIQLHENHPPTPLTP